MAQSALSALDLPLKIIAWEDDQKKVWLAYNEANYIRKRYTLTEKLVAPLKLDLLIKQGLKP